MENSNITLIHNGRKIPIEYSVFPAGEEYVKIIGKDIDYSSVFTVIITSADSRTIIRAIMVADAVKQINTKAILELHADYLPYGRQDRVCSNGESFSLKVFNDIIRTRFNKIVSYDVHSRTSEDIIDVRNTLPFDSLFYSVKLNIPYITLSDIKSIVKPDVIIAPDAGARERAYQYSNKFKTEVINLDKTRTDGKIFIKCKYDLAEYETGIITDDICDGAGTFLAAAKVLKKINPDIKLYLIISHGIFSKGTDILLKEFEDIYVPKDNFNSYRLSLLGKNEKPNS